MKMFIKNIIAFLFFSFICYYVLLVLVGEFAPHQFQRNISYKEMGYGHTFSRLHDADTLKNIDVLILGSSHAYRGFDTRIFEQYNLKAFNLGTSAQTPIQTHMLIDRYLKTLKPKIIIYEVYPLLFSNDGTEASLDILSNSSKIDMPAIKMVLKSKSIKVYNTLLFSIYIKKIKKNHQLKEPIIKDLDRYLPAGGFVERNITYNSHSIFENSIWNLDKKQVSTFESIMRNLSTYDADVILIQAPITKKKYDSYSNNKEIDDYFSTQGKYYNFNNFMELNDTLHFYDSHHLNQNGVNLFTEEVIKHLKKNNYVN